MSDGPQAVILAAGQGKRMRSSLAKVLHPLGGQPLIQHVVTTAIAATGRAPVVVVAPGQPEVGAELGDRAIPVEQSLPRGTGDAVAAVPPHLRTDGPVLVLYGDIPLLREATIRQLLEAHAQGGIDCVLMAARPADPSGLGRVMRDSSGRVTRIVEERDLGYEADTGEVNAGAYVFTGAKLWPALERLSSDNAQGEYYLTDMVEILGGAVAVTVTDDAEILGINDRTQLARAEEALRHRTLRELMLSGVTIEDPATTYVDPTVRVGEDSVIRPLTVLRGQTVLGSGCEIGPMAQLRDVRGGDRLRIGASILDACSLGDDVTIGHFDRIRPDSRLESGVSLGTHAEVKNSIIGAGTRINHFSCVLDSDVGAGVNIGAGTVTCNFDGSNKSRTVIGDGAFVGTNSTLVAPLTIEALSYVAAGSVVTMDVPAGSLAVGRAHQRNVDGWVARRHPTEKPG